MSTSTTMRTCAAPEALRPFVSAFALRDAGSDSTVLVHLPDLRPSIQIIAADPYWLRAHRKNAPWARAPGIGFWGPRLAREYGFAQGHIRIFGIGLHPAGARHILGATPGTAAGRVIALCELAPRLAQDLAGAPCADFDHWCAAAAHALCAAFEDARPGEALPEAALALLATEQGGAVTEAARLSGLSERHFRRVFRADYGVSPKLYQRFQRVDRMLRGLHPRPWEVDPYAQEPTGYADQAHAIREFRKLTGMTPQTYARLKAQDRDSVLRSVPASGVAPPQLPFECGTP